MSEQVDRDTQAVVDAVTLLKKAVQLKASLEELDKLLTGHSFAERKLTSLAHDDLFKCARCIINKPAPPAPPPMRKPLPASVIPSAGSMLVVLVFLSGVAVGTKMAGGW